MLVRFTIIDRMPSPQGKVCDGIEASRHRQKRGPPWPEKSGLGYVVGSEPQFLRCPRPGLRMIYTAQRLRSVSNKTIVPFDCPYRNTMAWPAFDRIGGVATCGRVGTVVWMIGLEKTRSALIWILWSQNLKHNWNSGTDQVHRNDRNDRIVLRNYSRPSRALFMSSNVTLNVVCQGRER
jgi:hypothetical protein